jgi:2-polyprenyl-3-methyl-5-hydroxy-6-metoxy-1,4-benzoquinol methylase
MDNIYDRVFIKSIEEPLTETYDLIYSMTLLEHVKDNIKSITSIYNGLNTGGLTVHYIPSKYHPYSIILQMVGPILGKKLVQLFYPESKGLSGYKTFFNKCSPDEMKNVFESCGFSNIELIPFYRTSYFRFFFPLYILILYYENVCEYFKLHKLCSGFIISATK